MELLLPDGSFNPEATRVISEEVATVSEKLKSTAALKILLHLIPDDRKFMEIFFRVRPKKGPIVSFRFNKAQEFVWSIIQDLQQKELEILLIILKYRQGGISTLIQACFMMKMLRNNYCSNLVVADKADNAEWIFQIGNRMYLSLPKEFQPLEKYRGRQEIILEEPIGSDYAIETAKNVNAGRSRTIHNMHLSEVAFWDQPDLTMSGLNQARVEDPNNWIVFESTANGMGGYFYEKWKDAKNGISNFVPIFLPWWMAEDYVRLERSPEYQELVSGGLDDEEEKLEKNFSVSLPALAWRRWAIKNKCDNNVDIFHQEYPSTDVEAFLTSGRTAFPVKDLEAMLQNAPTPLFSGELNIYNPNKRKAASHAIETGK